MNVRGIALTIPIIVVVVASLVFLKPQRTMHEGVSESLASTEIDNREGVFRADSDSAIGGAEESEPADRQSADELPALYEKPPFCSQRADDPFTLTRDQTLQCAAFVVLRQATESNLSLSDLKPNDRFLVEPRDPDWAGPTESNLLSVISRIPGLVVNTIEVECKTTVCQAEFQSSLGQQEFLEQSRRAAMQLGPLAADIGLEWPTGVGAARDGGYWLSFTFPRSGE